MTGAAASGQSSSAVVYVHIPFCRTFCTYCGFYSETADCYGAFTEALLREIRSRADEIRASGGTDTVYFGGGTPSVLPLPLFLRILSALREAGGYFAGPEITVELNPDDVVRRGGAYAEALLEAGVTRASLGVQSFDDGVLRWMNRRHDAATAVKAYRMLEAAGFDNIGIDLIFGLPSALRPGENGFRPLMTPASWNGTMDRALGISASGRVPRHISAYQLSVEPDSALEKSLADGRCAQARDEDCAAEYELLCSRLAAEGYRHYEISNFAQPGFVSRHNSAYWTHRLYTGLGPGAHSLSRTEDGRFCRRWNDADLSAYLRSSGEFPHGSEILTDEQLGIENVMLGLRTAEGCTAEQLRPACNPDRLDSAIAGGLLVPAGGGAVKGETTEEPRFRIPEKYFFISDRIISELLED